MFHVPSAKKVIYFHFKLSTKWEFCETEGRIHPSCGDQGQIFYYTSL